MSERYDDIIAVSYTHLDVYKRQTLEDADILGGLPVDGGVLWCATEKASKAALDKTISVVKEVLAK